MKTTVALRRGRTPLAVLLLAVLASATARAQEPSTTTTSTPTSTTSTTSGPPVTVSVPPPPTSVVGPGATTTTTAPPPAEPADPETPPPADEAAAEEPPPVVEVPPPPGEVPPPPPAGIEYASRVVGRLLAEARREEGLARSALAAIDGTVRVLEQRAALQFFELQRLSIEERAAADRVETAHVRLVERAVSAYTGESLSKLNALLEAGDVNELARRIGFLDSVFTTSQEALDAYRQARREAGIAVVRRLDEAQAVQRELDGVRQQQAEALARVDQISVQVKALSTGSAVLVKGFVFPVAGPHRFWNDFGAPRMMGTAFAHYHQGTDIFAEYGTPLVAVERGVLTRIGTDRLGGTKLWLIGASGTRYYYAHLSGYAPDLLEGLVVDAGRLVGFVGDTGNARGTSPHLHFEVHPADGPAVNPYPLLKAVSDAERLNPRPPVTSTSAPPGIQ